MVGLRPTSYLIAIAWLSLSAPALTSAEPFIPTHDSHVLERLSVKRTDPVTREVSLLRATLSTQPDNLDVAVSLATKLIEQARSDGDPRFLGQAQATLALWWNQPDAPPAVLLLRATIRQNAHEFDLALADLDAVLSRQPTSAQAWLTKASILQVQGRYDAARQACQPLTRLVARHIALACVSDVASLTGQAAASRELLSVSVDRPGLSARERLWMLTLLAEMAGRMGDAHKAEQYFSEARRLDVKDQYLLGAYADFLLDQGRAREVVMLLQQDTRADGLLLRLALAEQALHLPTAKEHTAILAARFAASRERGTRVHVREEARFTLALLHDPRTALALAQDNWNVQKEPWDARLLLESAVAAGDPTAAKPALKWLDIHHVEDIHLRRVAAQLSRQKS